MDNSKDNQEGKVLEFRDIKLEKKMNEMYEYLVNLIGVNSMDSDKKRR
jgi:hypothetical protein